MSDIINHRIHFFPAHRPGHKLLKVFLFWHDIARILSQISDSDIYEGGTKFLRADLIKSQVFSSREVNIYFDICRIRSHETLG